MFDKRRPPIGYTWQHHQDGKTMQLVEKNIHDEFKHIGGQSKTNGKNSK
ncbi:HNH endonuclease [Bacillus sp. WMMC1349]